MATILAFKPAPAAGSDQPTRAALHCAASKPAELIFFPGVRYERHETLPEPQLEARTRRKRRTRQHDAITLPD